MELAALPTDLLQRCFAGASLADRCALACTCRRLAAITATAGRGEQHGADHRSQDRPYDGRAGGPPGTASAHVDLPVAMLRIVAPPTAARSWIGQTPQP